MAQLVAQIGGAPIFFAAASTREMALAVHWPLRAVGTFDAFSCIATAFIDCPLACRLLIMGITLAAKAADAALFEAQPFACASVRFV